MNGEKQPPSPDTTLAILLGVSKCPQSPHLAELPGAANAAQGFYDYATGQFGLLEANIKDLFDSRKSPADQLREVGDWLFGNRQFLRDLVIFYAGHGGFTPGDRKFFLATRHTTEQLEGGTSLRVTDLAAMLKNKAQWARKYLIFDCCFAGAAVAEFMSSPASFAAETTKEEFPASGMTILCSSSSQELSIAPTGARYTRFSDALLGVLREGNARVPTALSFSDVGAQVRERMLENFPEDKMRPEIHSPDQGEGDVAMVRLFPNPALSVLRLQAEARHREKERLEAERRETEVKKRLEAERRRKEEQERLEAERRETKATPGIDSRISDVSEIDDINESVLAQLSEIGHRMLHEFNIDNTIHSLLETNSVGIHCWSTIKEPGKVIAFFILAPISRTTCKRVLETDIRGAKQLRKTDFVKKTGNAGGIYIMCIVATKWRYRAYLMKHLKEEIAFLLTRNPGIEYIFTRPINRNVASLATKYGFTRIADYPSPIFCTTRSKMLVKDELLYPYRKSDKKAPAFHLGTTTRCPP